MLADNSWSRTSGRACDDRRDDSEPFEPRIKVDRDKVLRLDVASQTYRFCLRRCLRADQLGAVDRDGALTDALHVLQDAGSAR